MIWTTSSPSGPPSMPYSCWTIAMSLRLSSSAVAVADAGSPLTSSPTMPASVEGLVVGDAHDADVDASGRQTVCRGPH